MPFILAYFLMSSPLDSLHEIDKQDRWLSEDKFEHIFFSSFLLGSSYCLYRYELNKSDASARQVGIGIALFIGISKELYDLADRGNPSFKDILADIIGIVIGVLVFT